jgi:hypothetical protein
MLAVRVNVTGHASPRWKSATSAQQAARLNQQLSVRRAENARQAIERMLTRELPLIPIAVPSKGVGSSQRFPTASEDNAAVDRSVFVTIELTTTDTTLRAQARPPRRVYVPSKVWTLRVLSLAKLAAGFAVVSVRIAIRNPYSGKQLIMSGNLLGGGGAGSLDDVVGLDRSLPEVGEVDFETSEALDFDDFANDALVRLGSLEAALFIKAGGSYLRFVSIETKPQTLVFDSTVLGFGLPGGHAFLVTGRLGVEHNPGDFMELPSVPDLVVVESSRPVSHNGLLLSFPTGKSNLSDLTAKDQQQLRQFVTLRARAISALADSFNVSGAP